MSTAPTIFSRPLVAANLARAGAQPSFVRDLVLADLADRLETISRDFERALILSPDAEGLPREGRSAKGSFPFEMAATVRAPQGVDLVDPERLELPGRGYDLIVSLLDLQMVNDVPGYLGRARAHLAPDGLFLAAFVGGDSLTELRQAFLSAEADIRGGASARVAPMIPLKDAAGLLQRAGFALPVADVEAHSVRYADPLALCRELRALGAANPLADRPKQPMTRTVLAHALEAYRLRAGDADGRVRATLEIVWLSGWAPHESQQQPLAPGSAEISLTKVLGRG